MLIMSVVAGLVAIQSGAPPLRAAVSSSEINSIAKKVRSFSPKDEFDAPPAQTSLSGREFMIDVQPWGSKAPPVACFGYPMWSYEIANRTLYVSTGKSDLMLNTFPSRQGAITKKPASDIWGEKIQYFASDCTRADLPGYTASNAYGAEFRIEPTLQTITAIADALPKGSEWPDSFTIQTSGEEARSLVPNLRVRFSGILADWKPGVGVACGSKRDSPTAGSPYDRRLDLCLFNGRIIRIDLLDARSGKVLQSLTRPAD